MRLKRFVKSTKKIRIANRSRHINSSDKDFSAYIFRVLNRVHPGFGVSRKTLSIMNLIILGVFHMIAKEAARLGNSSEGPTITTCEIQTAVRLMFSANLAANAVSEGRKAVGSYKSFK
ncbi:core histone H2A/H2B/H3/H4 [Ancylostoma caninum]|uniref:Core histone H2A/H2B/H3/H4 n=1 Tax=Ancylostoma caninum TaxID=29170 RepID=A0A368H2J8_ANCCA|nr:core histone H2A/H2B/H3/H4 [Ancylostoma caninum]